MCCVAYSCSYVLLMISKGRGNKIATRLPFEMCFWTFYKVEENTVVHSYSKFRGKGRSSGRDPKTDQLCRETLRSKRPQRSLPPCHINRFFVTGWAPFCLRNHNVVRFNILRRANCRRAKKYRGLGEKWQCPFALVQHTEKFWNISFQTFQAGMLFFSGGNILTRSLPRDVYIRRKNDHPGGQGRIYTSNLNFFFTHLSKLGHRRGCCCMFPRCLLRQFVDRCFLSWALFIEKTVLLTCHLAVAMAITNERRSWTGCDFPIAARLGGLRIPDHSRLFFFFFFFFEAGSLNLGGKVWV